MISMFNEDFSFPHTFEDVERLYYAKIERQGAKEHADAFTWSELSTKGRSYFFYGLKVFEFYPGEKGKARWKLPADIVGELMIEKKDWYSFTENTLSGDMLMRVLNALKKKQESIFRNTITERFACCNSFVQCSDQKSCLYPNDRFYNGCVYRQNLEAGRIFYGQNRNA